MRQRIVRWVLINLLAGERIWAAVLVFLLIMAAALVPLVLVGWLDPMIAFFLVWLPAVACAFAAHSYRARAILWEALCQKSRRESNEFIESFLKPQVVEVVIQANGERMPN